MPEKIAATNILLVTNQKSIAPPRKSHWLANDTVAVTTMTKPKQEQLANNKDRLAKKPRKGQRQAALANTTHCTRKEMMPKASQLKGLKP